MNDIGYIYCFSNPSYENIYKIGFTKGDPEIRRQQLNTTGVLYPFKSEFTKKVQNVAEKEKKIHKIFLKYRVNANREFFKISLEEIKNIFDLLDEVDDNSLTRIIRSAPIIQSNHSVTAQLTAIPQTNTKLVQQNIGANVQNLDEYICTLLGTQLPDIQADLTVEKCRQLFDQLQTSYIKISNLISQFDKQRYKCVHKLTIVHNKFKELDPN
jgi:Ca2+-binding EF-hand superfamily protein